MTPEEFVKCFGLDKPSTCDTFDRPLFIGQLNYDLEQSIKAIEEDHDLSYIEFKDLILEAQDKFQKISSMKSGRPLTKKLWNAFYAKHVLPLRAAYFPLTHRRILTRVEKRNRDKLKNHDKN